MKKTISFYLSCCLSIILMWLVTNNCNIGSPDFKFGIHLLITITMILYAPLCTIVAFIFYHFKINRVILSYRWAGVLYCIFPYLFIWLSKQYCHYAKTEVDYRLDDISPLVFLIQNILVITHWMIFKKPHKQCKKLVI